MLLRPTSSDVNDYLRISNYANFEDPIIKEQLLQIQLKERDLERQGRLAFDFVRDQIRHSFDFAGELVTISATEAIRAKEGICFAKSHLLAALLRGLGIPTGFCYQRMMRKGTVESGFALHGLNAVFFPTYGWKRVDPRGDKQGIHSEFSLREEILAYKLNEDKGEADDPRIFSDPLPEVIRAMSISPTVAELFYNRPEKFPAY